jgi:protein-S-isoprenylcysteine O-methyltransferase Ste14
MNDLFKMSIISSVWILVWVYSYYGGPKKPTLTTHPKLHFYSTLVLLGITAFYTVSYRHITSLTFPLSVYSQCSLLLMIAGSGLLLGSTRSAVANLSYQDILFGKNPTYTASGPYRYVSHPMYIGITTILSASYLLFPTLLGGIVELMILFLLWKKAITE